MEVRKQTNSMFTIEENKIFAEVQKINTLIHIMREIRM